MEPLTGRIPRDQNRVPVIAGVSSADGVTVIPAEVNPVTNRILVDSVGSSSLPGVAYDYLIYTNTSSTVDTYVFKTGGAGGSTVATLTITYTDTTKNQVSTVAKT